MCLKILSGSRPGGEGRILQAQGQWTSELVEIHQQEWEALGEALVQRNGNEIKGNVEGEKKQICRFFRPEFLSNERMMVCPVLL